MKFRPLAGRGQIMATTAFISYSWDSEPHKHWVGDLAKRLRNDGIDATFDRWETAPGDQLPEFMEQAMADHDFILIICTPRYKTRSEAREGGVGYEGHVMTAEVMHAANHRKFIPILRNGEWRTAAPSWLQGKYHVDLSGDPYSEEEYAHLVRTILGLLEPPPPLGEPMSTIADASATQRSRSDHRPAGTFEDIKLTGVQVKSVTEPLNNGSVGSALYSVPISLSHVPDAKWSEMFIQNWDSPPSFTSMHRPGIASVRGATVVLNGTTIEEIEKYHQRTLSLAVAETNRQYRTMKDREEQLRAREQAHRSQVEDVAKRIKFE